MAEQHGLLDPADTARLREALSSAGFTPAGIAERLGPVAMEAAGREDFRPTLATTVERDRLNTLIRLFLAGQIEAEADVASALKPLPLARALEAELIEFVSGGIRAGVDLDLYGDFLVVADLPAAPGRALPTDHVLGVGGASMTLADCTIRRPVGTALDLGTGCGVQALHVARHAESVTATDLSARALRFAATTAALNGQQWELLEGDMLAPVAGRRFDLVVSNPPFVVGPGVATHTYRDSGRPGDGICAELAAAAGDLLNPGGTMQFLANWVHVAGEDWEDRIAGWFEGTGCDVWAIQREVTDPLDYVRLWLRDASEGHDPQRAAEWLDWFDQHKIEGIGFGLITARRSDRVEPIIVCEDLRQTIEAPVGDQVAAWFDRQEWLGGRDDDGVLDAVFRAADGLTLRQDATMSAEGWAVDRQVLTLTTGLRWSEEIDPLILALVSGCGGEVSLRDQVALLAEAHGAGEEELGQVLVGVVRHLVERGMLLPV
ncbi:methylase of polypeptide subunit release factors [Allocatelliglobosispora scoriae]|uniref:Methylase of polypeptide subunit release factors n=1 Tax=Allocatelliglobosispora scoriae TaxID=643052 RepID=A0A841C078_9ACTN|nr:methyltransferase [Allocatelliglobosispora scoriae]MBB5872360.1 methylase of polypeptide subunit release factors [Allocatelliglobosispora scoriae]